MLTREIAAVIVKETMERLGENVNIFDNNELIKSKLNHLFMIIHGDIGKEQKCLTKLL